MKHKPAMNHHDMSKLYESGVLGVDNPVSLQRKIFIELGIHFGRRGREGWRALCKCSFAVKYNAQGRKYVKLLCNEFDKNHTGSEIKHQYVWEHNESPLCSIKSFEKYLSKLHPECPWLLQKPHRNFAGKQYWYCYVPLGVHSIVNMLKHISNEADTSVLYTNHSLKATVGTILKKAGVCDKNIMWPV